MMGVIRRFVAWVRRAIFGGSTTRPEEEVVPPEEEEIREVEGSEPPVLVESSLDDLPETLLTPSGTEIPLLTEDPGESSKEEHPKEEDEQALSAPAREGIPPVMERPGDAPGGGTSSSGNERAVSGPASATNITSSTPGGWVVHPGRESVFEKVGRAYIENGDLVIRLDRDPRIFLIREHDLDKALTDGEGKVRSTGNSRAVGTTRVSTSGRALNIVIEETLYTIPLRWLMLVLSGKRRKAAVWRGK